MRDLAGYISLLVELNPELISQNRIDSKYVETIKRSYNVMLKDSDALLKEVTNLKEHDVSKQKTIMFNSKIQPELVKFIDVLKETKGDIEYQKKEKEMRFMLGTIKPEGYNSIVFVLNDYKQRFEDMIEKMEKVI